jgi:hypothetical protein
MRATTVLLLNAAFANAHWVTSNFIFDNRITGEFEYVRPISPIGSASTTDPETRLAYPNTDPDSTDLTCGRNATTHGAGVKTAIIAAGDKVGFFVGRGISVPPSMYHPGFGSAWLSRAPSDLESYPGDGLWYKIHQTAGRTEQSPPLGGDKTKNVWGTYNAQTWNFTIPRTTPPGRYLIRWESIFPNTQDAQFYVNCAHVKIVNEGVAVEPEGKYLVKIPGVYVRGQKDVYFSTYDYGVKGSLEGFVPPKPEVFKG